MSLARCLLLSSSAVFLAAEAELRLLQAHLVALEPHPSVEAGSAVLEESILALFPVARPTLGHHSVVLFAPLRALIQRAGDFLCLGTILTCICHHLGTMPYLDFVLAGYSRHSPALTSSFLLPVGMPPGTSWFWHRGVAWQHMPTATHVGVGLSCALSRPVAA